MEADAIGTSNSDSASTEILRKGENLDQMLNLALTSFDPFLILGAMVA